ncbi:uncharacterized protein ACN63O_022036, partial [Diretmus argenteus]
NLSNSRWAPQVGSTSSYIEDVQVGVVKNLQGDGHPATAVMVTGGVGGVEKNRNSINYERQQAQVCVCVYISVSTTTGLTPVTVLSTISESEHTGGAAPSVPVCLQLTEEDLEATKLDPKEVDKNLRESSDENLMEHSQKQFTSDPQTTNLLYPLVNGSLLAQSNKGGAGGSDTPSPSSVYPLPPLPKQQNLPQRPTSLHLHPETKETTSASSRLKFGKHKSNNRQVETGVAKMNTVTVSVAAEPHVVTTVTNNTPGGSLGTGKGLRPVTVVANGYSAGVPILVTNGMMGGGQTNLAGPQAEEEEEEEEKLEGEDSCLNLLNSSPDEHEPLLRREQPPAERVHLHHLHHHQHHHQPRPGNINNNNNRLAPATEIQTQSSQVKVQRLEGNAQNPVQVHLPRLEGNAQNQVQVHLPRLEGNAQNQVQVHLPRLEGNAQNPVQVHPPRLEGNAQNQVQVHLPRLEGNAQNQVQVHLPRLEGNAQNQVQVHLPRLEGNAQNQVQVHLPRLEGNAQNQVQVHLPRLEGNAQNQVQVHLPRLEGNAQNQVQVHLPRLEGNAQNQVQVHLPRLEGNAQNQVQVHLPRLEGNAQNQVQVHLPRLEGNAQNQVQVHLPRLEAPEAPAPSPEPSAPEAPGLSEPRMRQARSRRPERPCSLDLSSSSSCPSADASLMDDGGTSVSGEKIKRRVKTPYALKKWRPASWVVSTDTTFDLDSEFSSSNHHRPGNNGVSKINQSKSSMAVFLVGGGATATMTSNPNGMTCL